MSKKCTAAELLQELKDRVNRLEGREVSVHQNALEKLKDATARIAELEAELARLRESRDDWKYRYQTETLPVKDKCDTLRYRITKLTEAADTECARLREQLAAVTAERDAMKEQVDDLSDNRNPRRNEKVRNQRKEINELHKCIGRLTAERDALQARIDAGVRVYRSSIDGAWTCINVEITHTAILIDRQPIAQDERKGERRESQFVGHVSGLTGERVYPIKDMGKYKVASRTLHGANDRRRTPGTMADRNGCK